MRWPNRWRRFTDEELIVLLGYSEWPYNLADKDEATTLNIIQNEIAHELTRRGRKLPQPWRKGKA